MNVERPPFTGLSKALSDYAELHQEVVLQPEVYRQFEKLEESYPYWTDVKYHKMAGTRLTPHELWGVLKVSRFLSQRMLFFNSTLFRFTLTSSLQRNLHSFDLDLGGSLSSSTPMREEDRHRYLISSLMEEAITSSQIEGALTTRKKAKELLAKGLPARTKSDQMIINTYQTIRQIHNWRAEPLTPEHLLELHRIITKGTLDDLTHEGAFREDDEVQVIDSLQNEAVHQPPSHQQILAYVTDLCHFFNHDEGPFIHPIVKACIVHFWMGWLHPFVDGNGRTARALFYWFLLRRGYWLVEYLSISSVILQSRTQYAKAFLYTEYDDNDLTYFIRYQVQVVRQALDNLKGYLNRKTTERNQVGKLVRDQGLTPRQAQIMSWLGEDPDAFFTVREMEHRLGVSNQTARTDLDKLVKREYLTRVAVNAKEQHYVRGPRFGALFG